MVASDKAIPGRFVIARPLPPITNEQQWRYVVHEFLPDWPLPEQWNGEPVKIAARFVAMLPDNGREPEMAAKLAAEGNTLKRDGTLWLLIGGGHDAPIHLGWCQPEGIPEPASGAGRRDWTSFKREAWPWTVEFSCCRGSTPPVHEEVMRVLIRWPEHDTA